jgi:hypothetical protein
MPATMAQKLRGGYRYCGDRGIVNAPGQKGNAKGKGKARAKPNAAVIILLNSGTAP